MFNDRQGNFSSFFQRKRLEGRGTETKESLQKRLDTAQEALEYGRVLFSLLIFPEKLLHAISMVSSSFLQMRQSTNSEELYLSKQLSYEQQINVQYEINENS